MMSERWKKASAFFALFLSDLSLISGSNTCLETKLSKVPMSSTLFVDIYNRDLETGAVIFLCDMMTASSEKHGDQYIRNMCKNGSWTYDDYDLPDCIEKKSWCFSKFSFGHLNKCYRWIVSINWETSKYLCSRYPGSHLAVIDDNHLLEVIKWYLVQEGTFKKARSFFWVGLHKIKGNWSWVRNPDTNDWQNMWQADHPRGDLTKAALLYPDMKLYTVSHEEQLLHDARMYALCETDINETMYPEYRQAKRLNILKGEGQFAVEVQGAYFQPPYLIIYDEIQKMRERYKNVPKLLNEGETELRKIFEEFNTETKYSYLAFHHLSNEISYNKGGSTILSGMRCDRFMDKPVRTLDLRVDDYRYVPVGEQESTLNEMYSCSIINNDTVRLFNGLVNPNDTGIYLLSDWSTGMFQDMYLFVIDNDGWSHWTDWSVCTIHSQKEIDENWKLDIYLNEAINSDRIRICGAAFDPERFPNVQDCRGKRSHVETRTCSKDSTINCMMSNSIRGKEYYQGNQANTSEGYDCQRWDSNSPHKHSERNISQYPDSSIAAASNYCRNPDGSTGGPWCFTTDPKVEWKYCGIKECGANFSTEDLDVVYDVSGSIGGSNADVEVPDEAEETTEKNPPKPKSMDVNEKEPGKNNDDLESSGMACIYCYNYHTFSLWLIISCTLLILSRIQY